MCKNTRTYYIANGFRHIEVAVQCGDVDPYGQRCLCEACQNDAAKVAQHKQIVANAAADNACLRSAGFGEI